MGREQEAGSPDQRAAGAEPRGEFTLCLAAQGDSAELSSRRRGSALPVARTGKGLEAERNSVKGGCDDLFPLSMLRRWEWVGLVLVT